MGFGFGMLVQLHPGLEGRLHADGGLDLLQVGVLDLLLDILADFS